MEQAAATNLANHIMGSLFKEIDTKIKMLKGVRSQSESLRRELNMLVARSIDELTDRGDAPRTAVARECGEQMRELMHDMEDCIERFLHRITCDEEAGPLRVAAHTVKTLGIRGKFAKEMKKLKQRLQEFGSGRSPVAAAPPAGPRCLAIENSPVGIAKAKEDLLVLLDEAEGEAEKLRVISIVGFAGSGKTTLANAVYKSAAAVDAQRFPLRAWVRRSHYRDASGLLKKIINEFWGEAGEADTRELDEWGLEEYLQQNLGKQRYIIVLVDMDMRHWRWIELTFKDNGTSSRIIVTTNMLSTAKQCSSSYGDGYVYRMPNLGDKDSEKIALIDQQAPGDPASRTALLQKCDGLPLALVSVASHVRSRIHGSPTRDHCTKLCSRLGSFLHEQPDPSGEVDPFAELRGVLMDNYTSLPYCTGQPSLLYLGIFPDGRSLKRNKITRRWVAEGYARSKDPRRSEQEVADANFKEFMNRNIIQPVGVSSRICKALGIVHEFVVHKSISNNFITPFNAPEFRTDFTSNVRHAEKVRHLFINDSNVTSSRTKLNMNLSCVRSLTVLSESAGEALSKFSEYKMIRVLDLEKCRDVNDHHLRRICRLWNLRYLSLGGSITKLPTTIAKLKLLQTLTVSKEEVTELPVEVLGLPCLIHLIGKFTLPKKLPKKERLKKLCEENKLQTLAGFIANGNQGFLQLIVHSKNLRKVKIWCESTGEVRDINNLNNDLVKAIQEYSKDPLVHGQVRSLSVDFQIFPEGDLPVGTIYHLSSLKLHGNLSTVPRLLAFLSVEELTHLCLSLTVLTRELLSAISGMRYLVHLKLISDKVSEGLVIEIGEFERLQRLYFVVTRPDAVASRMHVRHGYLPELVSLQLLSKHLAGTSGIEIRHFTKLQEIELHPEVSEAARQEWEAAARNHPNRPNVLPSKCVDHPVASAAPVGDELKENPVAGAAPAGDVSAEDPVAGAGAAGDEPAEKPAAVAAVVADEPTENPVASTASEDLAPADKGPRLIVAQNEALLSNHGGLASTEMDDHQPTENQTAPEEAAPDSTIPAQPVEEASNHSPVQMDHQDCVKLLNAMTESWPKLI
ncbi:disease resistance protein RGA4-like [Phragmites australis]|uniref:disease resistance protein RGA4-like n=1 Tax=Phragmites australis TaxID=29695 RepID=UPI002D7A2515|nr:disease resistance protein RGA4-like [Phragmites australis]